jgi:hypothetical protein
MMRNKAKGRTRPVAKIKTCESTGKVRYPDGRAAVRALHQAATARHFAELDGVVTRRREARHYHCSHCQGWHLTSQASWALTA